MALQFLSQIKNKYTSIKETEMSLEDYLLLCKTDSSCYATAAERLLKAIGDPILCDTSRDTRLGRIFGNRIVKIYPAFKEFYGMEETVERIVNYLKYSAQGLEERKQIIYLLGPVGGGKSSLAEKIKSLMEKEPIFVLKYKDQLSPVFESPLELFKPDEADSLFAEYNIPQRLITGLLSPWGVKRLEEAGGDVSLFSVVKMYPSRLKQVGIMKVEPGDENNQDISTMVGKTDIRKLEKFSQNDPDSYSFSGGLNRTTQGIMEFVEMFKAPIKMLHPLLTATQEGNYVGTETIGAIPFRGIVLAHSNVSEWKTFKNNPNNEAFIDRIYLVQVPYCLRVSEEKMIYEKLLKSSELANTSCAPHTLEMLSRFSVLSRLSPNLTSGIGQLFSKMEIYDGKSLKDTDPNAKSYQEYKDSAGVNEGMDGSISTRFGFKVLSDTFNQDSTEISADPVYLMYVLENHIMQEQFPEEEQKHLLDIIKNILAQKYSEFIGDEIQKAYIESYHDYGQNMFDRYISWADAWIEDQDFKDPDTGTMLNRSSLNKELEEIEKASSIPNPKDFRNEIVKFALRARANNGGKNPSWTSYEKIRDVIETKMFGQIENLLPVISFGKKGDAETEKKHTDFVERMMKKGYTEKQIRRLVDWYIRVRSHN